MFEKKDFFKGISHGLGLSLVLSFMGIVYATGWHIADEIVSGTFSGNYSFSGKVNFSNASVSGIIIDSIPTGAIMAFKGNCPTGWSEDTTLRGKFLRGEPTGNSTSLNAGGTDDAIAIAHSHTASSVSTGSHAHTGSAASAGSHTHGMEIRGPYIAGTNSFLTITSEGRSTTWSTAYTASAGAHTHSLSINTAGSHSHTITVDSAGSSGTGANMPTYQEVIFCIKD